MKKLGMIALGAILVVAVGVWWVLGSLDSIIKEQIEVVGSELTGVPVTVDEVKFDLGNGVGQISGLVIGNPEGYQSPNAFQMNHLSIGIDIKSLISAKPIVLTEIIIDSPEVNLEVNGKSSNLSDISNSIEKNSGTAEEKSTQKEGGEPLLIAIQRLSIKGVKLIVLEEGESTSQTLPAIDLENVGGEEGETAAGVAGTIVSSLIVEILKQAAIQGVQDAVKSTVNDATEGVFNSIKKALD